MENYVKYQRLIEIERLRNYLAIKSEFTKFKSTYKRKLYIKNLNSSDFWKKKTKTDQKNLSWSPIYKDKINIIYKYLAKEGGRVIDIGFGYGHLEEKLKKNMNTQIYGIDISKYIVNRAKRRFRGEFSVSDIYKLPYPRSFFDKVILLDVLEHIPPHKTFQAYKSINKVLKKGGELILSVPLNENLLQLIKNGKNPNAHFREYTVEILKAELSLFKLVVMREYKLYAFKKHYRLKSLLSRYIPFLQKKPNLLIIFAKKK